MFGNFKNIEAALQSMHEQDSLSDLCYAHNSLREVAPENDELKYFSITREPYSKFNTTFESVDTKFNWKHLMEFAKRFGKRTGFLGWRFDLESTLDNYAGVLRNELIKETLRAYELLQAKNPRHGLLGLVEPEQIVSFVPENWDIVLRKVAEHFDHLTHDSQNNRNDYFKALAGYVSALRTATQ